MTSSDIIDTAQATMMRESLDLILSNSRELSLTLKTLAKKHKNTPMMGRTHGIHAEPITFGIKFLVWLSEAERNIERLKAAQKNISVGCISGAVGTYSFIPPSVEAYVCEKLGLQPARVSTQTLQRDRHGEVLCVLALISSLCEKIALEMRHLQRTEVLEVQESFKKGQMGSSAMPHKKNPVSFEQICGLSRVIRGNLIASLENLPLWHERDISHSSVERIILPDSFHLCAHIIKRTMILLRNLQVDKKKMKQNMTLTRGLYYSQKLLLFLCDRGLSREEAYKIIQEIAFKVWENPDMNFKEAVLGDRRIRKAADSKDLNKVFDPDYFFKYIDIIYGRFGQ